MPEVKPLTQQLKKMYDMNGLKAAEEQLYRECWGIKQACGLVKRKGRRRELARDSWLKTNTFFWGDVHDKANQLKPLKSNQLSCEQV